MIEEALCGAAFALILTGVWRCGTRIGEVLTLLEEQRADDAQHDETVAEMFREASSARAIFGADTRRRVEHNRLILEKLEAMATRKDLE